MTDTESRAADPLERLEFQPQLDCGSRKHLTGTGGHLAYQKAAVIIERTHPTDPKHTEPDPDFVSRLLICQGRADYLTAHLTDRIHCDGCGVAGPLSDFVRIVGPIEGTPE